MVKMGCGSCGYSCGQHLKRLMILTVFSKLCLFPSLICFRRGNYSSQNFHVSPIPYRGSSQE